MLRVVLSHRGARGNSLISADWQASAVEARCLGEGEGLSAPYMVVGDGGRGNSSFGGVVHVPLEFSEGCQNVVCSQNATLT